MLQWKTVNGRVHLTNDNVSICQITKNVPEGDGICPACHDYLEIAIIEGNRNGWLRYQVAPDSTSFNDVKVAVNDAISVSTNLLESQFIIEPQEGWVVVLKRK